MIISASRRTDIPAFYAKWLMNRIHAGYCTVPNPFNPGQVSVISLRPEEVEVIVFWSRNPRPLLSQLSHLDSLGFRYYFQHTLLDNPPVMDPHLAALDARLRTFCELADHVGSERVIWRYDPIILSEITDPAFHLRAFARIAATLHGHTRRCVVSILDSYRKTRRRLVALAQQGIRLEGRDDVEATALDGLLRAMAEIAGERDMEIVSCAEEPDLRSCGIRPGKCVDDELIARVFGIVPAAGKDPSQRAACGCVASRDIGMYDSCLFGCVYCYATSSFERARANHGLHDPHSPSLLGWSEPLR